MSTNYNMGMNAAVASDNIGEVLRILVHLDDSSDVPPSHDLDSMILMLDKIIKRSVSIRQHALALRKRIAAQRRINQHDLNLMSDAYMTDRELPVS